MKRYISQAQRQSTLHKSYAMNNQADTTSNCSLSNDSFCETIFSEAKEDYETALKYSGFSATLKYTPLCTKTQTGIETSYGSSHSIGKTKILLTAYTYTSPL